MWVSVHIARSSAYMVSTTFPFAAVSTSWTMMLNNRGAITDPRGTYSFGGRRGSLPSDLPRSVAQEVDVVVHVARNSDLVEFL